MKILITGVAGFIGSNLTESLLKKGHVIYGIDNFDPFYKKEIKEKNISEILTNPNFHFDTCDITDANSVKTIFLKHKGFDVVIHLAAKAGVRPSIAAPADYINTNINGTYNLLKSMEEFKIKNLIFASSSSVYGNNATVPFKETDTTENPISPYAFTKKACELMIHSFYHLSEDLKAVNLRFFTVYGPRQRPDLAIHKFFTKIHNNESIDLYGDGKTSRDYTFIADTITGIESALNYVLTSDKKKLYEIFNIGNSSPITLIELIQQIEKTIGKKAKLNYLPGQPGDVDITFADISKASQILNYKPVHTIAEGLSEFNHWIKNQ